MKANYDFSNARRGAAKPATGKTRITIYLDDDVLSHFRDAATQEGLGYQTVINRTLRAAMAPAQATTRPAPTETSAALAQIQSTLDEMNQRLSQATQAPLAGTGLYVAMDKVFTQPGYQIFGTGMGPVRFAPEALLEDAGRPLAQTVEVAKPMQAKKRTGKFALRSPKGGARR